MSTRGQVLVRAVNLQAETPKRQNRNRARRSRGKQGGPGAKQEARNVVQDAATLQQATEERNLLRSLIPEVTGSLSAVVREFNAMRSALHATVTDVQARSTVTSAHSALSSEVADLRAQMQRAAHQRDTAIRERYVAVHERDEVVTKMTKLENQVRKLRKQCREVTCQRDAALEECHTLRTKARSADAATKQCKAALTERDATIKKHEAVVKQLNTSAKKCAAMTVERTELAKQVDALHARLQEAIRTRDAAVKKCKECHTHAQSGDAAIAEERLREMTAAYQHHVQHATTKERDYKTAQQVVALQLAELQAKANRAVVELEQARAELAAVKEEAATARSRADRLQRQVEALHKQRKGHAKVTKEAAALREQVARMAEEEGVRQRTQELAIRSLQTSTAQAEARAQQQQALIDSLRERLQAPFKQVQQLKAELQRTRQQVKNAVEATMNTTRQESKAVNHMQHIKMLLTTPADASVVCSALRMAAHSDCIRKMLVTACFHDEELACNLISAVINGEPVMDIQGAASALLDFLLVLRSERIPLTSPAWFIEHPSVTEKLPPPSRYKTLQDLPLMPDGSAGSTRPVVSPTFSLMSQSVLSVCAWFGEAMLLMGNQLCRRGFSPEEAATLRQVQHHTLVTIVAATLQQDVGPDAWLTEEALLPAVTRLLEWAPRFTAGSMDTERIINDTQRVATDLALVWKHVLAAPVGTKPILVYVRELLSHHHHFLSLFFPTQQHGNGGEMHFLLTRLHALASHTADMSANIVLQRDDDPHTMPMRVALRNMCISEMAADAGDWGGTAVAMVGLLRRLATSRPSSMCLARALASAADDVKDVCAMTPFQRAAYNMNSVIKVHLNVYVSLGCLGWRAKVANDLELGSDNADGGVDVTELTQEQRKTLHTTHKLLVSITSCLCGRCRAGAAMAAVNAVSKTETTTAKELAVSKPMATALMAIYVREFAQANASTLDTLEILKRRVQAEQRDGFHEPTCPTADGEDTTTSGETPPSPTTRHTFDADVLQRLWRNHVRGAEPNPAPHSDCGDVLGGDVNLSIPKNFCKADFVESMWVVGERQGTRVVERAPLSSVCQVARFQVKPLTTVAQVQRAREQGTADRQQDVRNLQQCFRQHFGTLFERDVAESLPTGGKMEEEEMTSAQQRGSPPNEACGSGGSTGTQPNVQRPVVAAAEHEASSLDGSWGDLSAMDQQVAESIAYTLYGETPMCATDQHVKKKGKKGKKGKGKH